MTSKSEIYHEISNQNISRYSHRYKIHGQNVKTLGWGTKEQQQYRFCKTLEFDIDFCNKIILDIGCGFGDYFDFINKQRDIHCFKEYIGVDLNDTLVNNGIKKYKNEQQCSFAVKDILCNSVETPIGDIGIMLGLINKNLDRLIDNYEYSFKMIKNAFSYVREVLVVDFLSTIKTKDYPEEEFVFYHNPSKVLEFALTLSENVSLIHNYKAIPQKEYLIAIYK